MPLDQNGQAELIRLIVPDIRCGGCIGPIETTLLAQPGVLSARVNLSERRILISFLPGLTDSDRLIEVLETAGFSARTQGINDTDTQDTYGRALLLRLGVSGFAAMNVMLLSISVWSGAEAATRDLLHWVSALIALPAIAYAGQPFFRSAANALAARRLNMDVPISLAIVLSSAHSVLETAQSAQHAYFDAGIMLVFFLLIGRYLEHRTRHLARSAAAELLAMTGRTARIVNTEGSREDVPLGTLSNGMIIEVLPGERMPADGTIVVGFTELDRALVTGESTPEQAGEGDTVHAGMLNLTGVIQVNVIATGDSTLLAEIARLVDAAEQGRGRYDRIADRAARIYAPLVHLLAGAAFILWLLMTGDDRLALQIGVAVLIITCPCALALAVPTVHMVTSARLFQKGIFLKDGAELERLGDIDMVVFDKTGTLTDGRPVLSAGPPANHPAWPIAAALATQSQHPFARAIASEAERLGIQGAPLQHVREVPGIGVEGLFDGRSVHLGKSVEHSKDQQQTSSTTLTVDGKQTKFFFSETLRPQVVDTCATLRNRGLKIAVLSGDCQTAVEKVSKQINADTAFGELSPQAKLAWLEARRNEGYKVLMVGDGSNDAPALASVHASMSPASAADVAKVSAGLVFAGESLDAVAIAHRAAMTARRRAAQSLAIAVLYNLIAIPMAFFGMVTPLFAAIAMSGSSILVMLNAIRSERSA